MVYAKKAMRRLGACQESIEWVGRRSIQRAWDECQKPEWMVWFLIASGWVNNDRQTLISLIKATSKLYEHNQRYLARFANLPIDRTSVGMAIGISIMVEMRSTMDASQVRLLWPKVPKDLPCLASE